MPHHLSGHIGRLRAGRLSATTVIVGLTATLMVATSLMIFLGSYKVGDALMAFWGAPEIQADPAYRACRAALAISKSVQAENAMREKRGDPPIRLRIGLHVGPVVVGNIGQPERINYTIVGDTVNVSQRIEALGKDIAADIAVIILVSDTVREAAEAEFDFQLVGDIPVKGREGAIRVYQLRANIGTAAKPLSVTRVIATSRSP